jgi:uncharacterized protein YecE (DUF72 family)
VVADVRIGTAGWTIPRHVASEFPSDGTSLERYAARFSCAEINSSFHRPHRQSTWQRWRDSVPAGFRFSAKLPKTITHQQRLADSSDLVAAFLGEVAHLGDRLAVLLVQLPPSLVFDRAVAAAFFADLGNRTPARLACEPRHPSWFEHEADALLGHHQIARVAADPARVAAAAVPGGWPGLRYWRLHGSPEIYRSSYAGRLGPYADQIEEAARSADCWCIFDNTASSAATSDALALAELIVPGTPTG